VFSLSLTSSELEHRLTYLKNQVTQQDTKLFCDAAAARHGEIFIHPGHSPSRRRAAKEEKAPRTTLTHSRAGRCIIAASPCKPNILMLWY